MSSGLPQGPGLRNTTKTCTTQHEFIIPYSFQYLINILSASMTGELFMYMSVRFTDIKRKCRILLTPKIVSHTCSLHNDQLMSKRLKIEGPPSSFWR